jgi:transposase InsO family protein
MSLATPIPLDRLCRLALVSRAGFYRWRSAAPASDPDLDLRDEIQRIALEYPYYGWPRITAELEKRGWQANHKRVYRIMREDNLLCLRRRKFVVVTTNSNHSRPVYPNLARGMALTGINQLWVADITYIRLELEFVYLAVVLDAFSRRVIGWSLERTLEDELTIAALRMAIGSRSPMPGLVHHSDRGIQYASGGYTGLLKDHRITISMSRKGNPYDNAFCESFMKTLKYDEVHRQEYRDLAEVRASIEHFLERVYNRKRLHSGPWLLRAGRVRKRACIGNRSAGMKPAVRFLRHGGICRPMGSCFEGLDRSAAFRTGPVQTRRTCRKFPRPTHRRDEFRPAIPQRGARQHCPSPLHRQPHPKTVPGSGTMNFQRTVNSVLTVCLSPGDNPNTMPSGNRPPRTNRFNSDS